MYLLVDAGNSSIKWNIYDSANKRMQLPPQSFLWRTDDLSNLLKQHWGGLKSIDAALISNVAGQAVQQAVQHYVQTLWGARSRVITTAPHAFGVHNGYKNPDQLGVDRWLAVLAASTIKPKQNVCVVQCGSAITIDTVTAAGNHKGGLIVPGAQMMKNALTQQTHGVKIGHSDSDLSPFTDSTSSAVNHGVILAAIGFVDRALSGIETELEGEVAKIISGGDASMIIEHSRHTYIHEPELVLKGLALYADENT